MQKNSSFRCERCVFACRRRCFLSTGGFRHVDVAKHCCLKIFGPGIWWVLARNQHLPSTFVNQVGDELTTGGVNTTHYLRGFVYLNLQSTSNWQVILDGLKLDGAAVGTTPYVIIDSGIRF